MTFRLSINILIIFSFTLQGQTTEIKKRISHTENNLLPNNQIAGSVFVHYNIYERMKFYNIPSISIAVINNDTIEWAKTYGLSDIKLKTKATVNTMYQANSMSKCVNALCILKLVDENKLNLDVDIRPYLKTWTIPENEFSTGKTITLRQILSHTAGFNIHGFDGYDNSTKLPNTTEILNGKPPANNELVKSIYVPGSTFYYSGAGYIVSQKILEDNINPDYIKLMQEKVLTPLKMTNSTFESVLQKNKLKNIAVAYRYNPNLEEIKGKYHAYPQASGSLWTTPTDYAKFMSAILKSFRNQNNSFLKYSTATEMLTPVKDEFALSFNLLKKGTEDYFSWNGAGEHGDIAIACVKSGKGVVIMVNSTNYDFIMYEILKAVATTYNWNEFYKPNLIKSILLSDTLLNKYVGEYVIKKYNERFIVRKSDNHLELCQNYEYFTNDKTFDKIYFQDNFSFSTIASKMKWKFNANGDKIEITDNAETCVAEKTK